MVLEEFYCSLKDLKLGFCVYQLIKEYNSLSLENMVYYWLLAKFVQLMLRFHWVGSPSERVKIFRYTSSSRRMVAFLVNIDERRKKKWSHFYKATATKPLQWSNYKVMSLFLSATLLCSYLVRMLTILFLSGKFLTYPGNKYKINWKYWKEWKNCPWSTHREVAN